jgi:hypothetical protein
VPENPRIEELRRRVQADPASIAFAALAEEFRRVGRFEDAIETCRTGLQRHPAYLSARVTLGRALIEVGEYDAAREELETVLRSAPENLAATRGLAQINERLGHSTEMHPDLHEIVREPIRLAALNPPPTPPQISFASSTTATEGIPPLENATADKPAEAWSAFEFAPPPEPGSTAGIESLDISLQAEDAEASEAETPVDIFAAALNRPQPPIAPPMTFETGTIAFEAPVLPPSPAPSEAPEDTPDAHIAATLVRLERFLGAIQSARHA